jgi:hypothetical protein
MNDVFNSSDEKEEEDYDNNEDVSHGLNKISRRMVNMMIWMDRNKFSKRKFLCRRKLKPK